MQAHKEVYRSCTVHRMSMHLCGNSHNYSRNICYLQGLTVAFGDDPPITVFSELNISLQSAAEEADEAEDASEHCMVSKL